jgi:guanine deaminase
MKMLFILFLVFLSNCSSNNIPKYRSIAIRGSILHFINNPFVVNENDSFEFFQDGILLIKDGRVIKTGEANTLSIPADFVVHDYRGKLIVPGFIDTHTHLPQTEMIGSYGEQLLDWLNNYTFPTEKKFADYQYAKFISNIFLKELLKNGTTTALVFGTVHPQSINAFFEEAEQIGLRMIAGKVMMDNPKTTPDYLRDTALSSYEESKQLIEKWHGKSRLAYAVTPRFAITSTNEQLAYAGKLLKEYPTVYLHTHLSENLDEIAFTKSLFPKAKNYLNIYAQHGLVTNKSIFAHGVHLEPDEISSLSKANSSLVFCPTSNLFLGSGLFKLDVMTNHQNHIKVGLGTDVGAGTSFSMLATMNEAYKVMQLQNRKLSALKSFYLATLGGAKALSLDDKIGNFETGKEADFIVIDPAKNELQRLRIKPEDKIQDKLFGLTILGDDRNILATYAQGRLVYTQK